MAAFSRVTPWGWVQGDDSSESSRVTPWGWVQVYLAGGGGAQTVAIGQAGALSLTGFAPTVSVSSGTAVQVPAGALSLTAFAPTVVTPRTVAVPAGSLSLTAFAPTVRVGADKIVSVPTGSLSLTALAPTVTTTANVSVSVPVAALTLTGYAPTVLASVAVEELRGRASRRRRTKFLPPLEPVEEEKQEPPAKSQIVKTLVPSDRVSAMAETAAEQAANTIRVAKLKSYKRRLQIDRSDQAAIEKALLEWF